MNKEKIRELEGRIAQLKKQWPAHSVPPSLMLQLEELEEELERVKNSRKNDSQ